MLQIVTDITRDKKFNTVGGEVHRPPRDHTRLRDRVVIAFYDDSLVVQTRLIAGFMIHFSIDGTPKVATATKLSLSDWAFDAKALKSTAPAIQWPDIELLDFLRFCSHDYSQKTPPVSWLAVHILSVYKKCGVFRDSVQMEIDQGWMVGP